MSSFKNLRSMTYAAVLLSFLLPFVSVSCPGIAKVNISGLDLIKGTTVSVPQAAGSAESRRFNAELLAQAAAACAGLGFLLSLATGGPAKIPFVGLGAAGAVLLLLLKNKIEGQAGGQIRGLAMLTFEPGYWVALLGFVASAIMSALRKPPPPTS